jgi:hypothetical protein
VLNPVLDQKFAESVSLSSTALADFPLPGTVLKLGFDLLGFRARRKEESRGSQGPFQGWRNTSRPQFAEIQLSTFPQHTVQLVENRAGSRVRVRARGTPPPSLLLTRLLVVPLGSLPGRFHLARLALGGRHRSDGVHRGRGVRRGDLPLRAGLRRGRTEASERASRTRSLNQAEEQQARQIGSEELAQALEHRPASGRLARGAEGRAMGK